MPANDDATGRAGLCAIAVMAKTPQPGRSKTRLCPPLTPEQAAAMSGAFLRDTTENLAAAARAAPIAPFVAYAPAGMEARLLEHLAPGTEMVLADGSPDMPPGVTGFGRCLLHAVRSLLDLGFGAACVLNSDGPTLPTSLLRQTAEWLGAPGDRAVLGPAEDGGYYMLGVKAAHVALFADIAWSTGDVAAQTRARAREAGVPLVELAPWYDVDDRESLQRLLTALAATDAGPLTPFAAPATRAAVERLGLRDLMASFGA